VAGKKVPGKKLLVKKSARKKSARKKMPASAMRALCFSSSLQGQIFQFTYSDSLDRQHLQALPS